VLAAAGVPRAALMLVGGAWADRFSPRTIMLVSDVLRALVTAALVLAIASGHVQLWMVYCLAIAFGIVGGFFMPAAEAAVPRLLPDADLESGNSLIMGADQLATFVGPALAGALIAWLGGAGHAGAGTAAQAASLTGIAIALGVDSASFLVSAATLVFVRPMPGLASRDTHPLHDVAEGLRFVAADPMLRMLVGVIALANLLVTGPMLVGVPVLAQTRFVQGAAAFGVIVSAYGAGNLVGMIGAGALPRVSDTVFGFVASGLFLVFGAIYASLGFVSSMWLAAGLMVLAGLGNGYVAILVMTGLQRVTPEKLMGRVMSLVMLAMVGLAPISQALSGLLVKVSAPALFSAAGIGMVAVGALVFAQRRTWVFPEAAPAAVAEA
jgi:MFS family permease